MMIDSLVGLLDYKTESESFWYAPPTRLYFGVSFSLQEFLRVGYLLHGEWSNGLFRPSQAASVFRYNNSLSAHFSLLRWLELGVANSFSYDGEKFGWLNPGLSVTVNAARRMQFYAAVDYVSNFYATDIRGAHIYFGVNLMSPKYNAF